MANSQKSAQEIVAGGSGLPKPAWPTENLQAQSEMIQSGENTCGPACSANLATTLGYGSVSEADIIKLTGSSVTPPEKLASALTQETGQTFVGGSHEELIPAADMTEAVNGYTAQGNKPFLALLYGDGAALNEGHWVVVKGTTASGDISILDPAGVTYTMQPNDFYNAWKNQNVVIKRAGGQ